MGTKAEPSLYDCYAAALADEPLFVLLARDPDAPELLRLWAQMRAKRVAAGDAPASDAFMINEANACAREMDTWRSSNLGNWRVKPG